MVSVLVVVLDVGLVHVEVSQSSSVDDDVVLVLVDVVVVVLVDVVQSVAGRIAQLVAQPRPLHFSWQGKFR